MNYRIIYMFFGVVLSLFFVWVTYEQMEKEQSNDYDGAKYRPILANNLIIAVPITLFFFQLYFHGRRSAVSYATAVIFNMFITFTVYYSILTVALPFFRKQISARACALLWLIPNFMYSFYNLNGIDTALASKFVIRVPNGVVKPLIILWALGFVAIMLYNIAVHIIFKRQILKDAVVCTDERVVRIFEEEKEKSGIKFKIKLINSPRINTPVSLGTGGRSKIILPEESYSDSDLHLILRHEIIHLGRDDSGAKFFMTFCTALCWLNPLVWYAMKRSAEDAELSCDETVLLNEDQSARERYAHLILENAGDERGFTTCLSASAEAMRYRLKSIAKPNKKHYGAITVGLMFLAVFSSFGQVALSYDHSDFGSKMDNVCDVSQFEYSFISSYNTDFAMTYVCHDPDGLLEYLRALQVSRVTGYPARAQDEKDLMIFYNSPEGTAVIILNSDKIQLSFLHSIDNKYTYALKDELDWEYLYKFIEIYPAITVYANGEERYKINPQLTELHTVENGVESTIFKEEEYDSGIFGAQGINYAEFKFLYPLACDYTVEIINLDTGEISTQIIEKDESKITTNFPSAQYRIYADFNRQGGGVYRTVFQFTISDKA